MAIVKLSDYVFSFIARQGVRDIFMLSGGGCMHLVDSVGRNKKLKYVCCLHEQVAALAAGAYAQYTNNLGVALVTTGPGGTNAITGVAAAWTDSIPLFVISGQVKRADISGTSGVRMLGFQEVDIVSIVKPITKYAVTVLKPETIRYHLEKAAFLAQTGRPGPVWIDIPLDVQASMINEDNLPSFNKAEMQNTGIASDEHDIAASIDKTIAMINASERPVIIAGYGIKTSRCQKEFESLAAELQIPVLLTWKAMDLLPEDAELHFGRPGCIGQRGANFIQQNSDLILSIGARLDFGQIGYQHESFAREAKKIIVDIDSAELQKFKFVVDLPIALSAELFINALMNQRGSIKKKGREQWWTRCGEWKKNYPVILEEHWKKTGFASTYALVDTLSDVAQETDLFVPENSGAASEIVMQATRLKKGQRMITTNSLGSMGTGLPATIGACIAGGNKRTICVNGDGGFQMNIQDLETVARLNLPIKFFILSNDGYGSIRNTQKNYFGSFFVGSEHSSGVTMPDIQKIANAYGIKFYDIKDNADIRPTVVGAFEHDGPVICNVHVDPAEPTMPRLTSQIKPDGTMVSKPLEDLWPFLDRDEFNRNMIVKPMPE